MSVETRIAVRSTVLGSGVARRRFRIPSSRRITSVIAIPANAVFAAP